MSSNMDRTSRSGGARRADGGRERPARSARSACGSIRLILYTPAVARPRARILIVGGGYVGLYTALGLQKRLREAEADITLVTPESFMTYQPFLPEAASGNIEP